MPSFAEVGTWSLNWTAYGMVLALVYGRKGTSFSCEAGGCVSTDASVDVTFFFFFKAETNPICGVRKDTKCVCKGCVLHHSLPSGFAGRL